MTAPPDLRDALIACLAERFFREPGQCGGHADALIDEFVAPWITRAIAAEAERDEAREEIDLVREDSAQQMRMLDAIAGKLGLAHDEGLEDAGPFLAAIDRLLIAFHDAIRRPLGVTPDSGAEFYDPRMAKEAEERRRLKQARGRHAYQPHKLYPQCAQCGYPESEALMHLPADDAELKERGGGSAA